MNANVIFTRSMASFAGDTEIDNMRVPLTGLFVQPAARMSGMAAAAGLVPSSEFVAGITGWPNEGRVSGSPFTRTRPLRIAF